jgi:hypothetical protein
MGRVLLTLPGRRRKWQAGASLRPEDRVYPGLYTVSFSSAAGFRSGLRGSFGCLFF